MSIDTLISLMPPPERHGVEPIDWKIVEAELGTTLPADYKRLAEVYGPGVFTKFIVYAPCPLEKYDLVSQVRVDSAFQRTMIAGEEDKERYYPTYPEPGGLLPWGYTTQASMLFWRTVGSPDEWPIVVESEFPDADFVEYPCSTVNFIVGILTGTINSWLIDPPDPDMQLVFHAL